MSNVSVPFGCELVAFEVPDESFVESISPRDVKPNSDAESLIGAAFANPIGSPRLEQIVESHHQVAIVVDDYTRPTPASIILPHTLRCLHAQGVGVEQVLIVFALGTHRAMTDAEISAKIGPEVAATYRIVNRSVHQDAEYVYVGKSEQGVPIWILEKVAQADIRIGIGSIVPHCDVGYAGGGKILLPGICSAQTVAANHIMGIEFQGRNYLGAPTTLIRQDIEDVIPRIGLQFIVNAVTTRDGSLYALVCGDYIQAHRVGVKSAREVYEVQARQRVDVTVCSAFPADMDFIQVCKSVWSGDKMTRPGGDLIIVTPCTEGVGPYQVLPDLMSENRHTLEARIRRNEIGQDVSGVMAALAVRLNRIGERIHISFVSSGLTYEVAKQMGYTHHDSIQDALAEALSRQGRHAKVSAITHGGYTYPIVVGEEHQP